MSTSLVASLLPSSVMMNSKLTCGDNSSYHSFNVGPMPAASLCTGITICRSGIMFDSPPFHCRFAETRCASTICGEDGQIKTEVLLARTIDLVLTDDAIVLICFLNREKQSRVPSGGDSSSDLMRRGRTDQDGSAIGADDRPGIDRRRDRPDMLFESREAIADAIWWA